MKKIDELYINDLIAEGNIETLVEIKDSFSYFFNNSVHKRIDLYFKKRAEIIDIIENTSQVSGQEDYDFEHDIFHVEAHVICKHIIEAKGYYTQALNEYTVKIESLKITVINNEIL
jgi:hypothetical protein